MPGCGSRSSRPSRKAWISVLQHGDGRQLHWGGHSDSDIGVVGDFERALLCPIRKPSFGECLEPPIDPFAEEVAVARPVFLAKYEAMLLAKLIDRHPVERGEFCVQF